MTRLDGAETSSGSEWAKQDAGGTIRTFFVLSLLTCILLLLIGGALIVQGKAADQPVLSMKGLAPSWSSLFFADMVRMELPGFQAEEGESYTFSPRNVANFLAQLLTNVNPRDPRTLIAGEVPGMRDDTVLLRRGMAGMHTSPVDYAPPAGLFGPAPDSGDGESAIPAEDDAAIEPGSGDATDSGPDSAGEAAIDGNVEGSLDGGTGEGESPDAGTGGSGPGGKLTTGDKKVVFIYHTHNRESWLPELPGVEDIDKAFDAKTNITLVGKRLAEQLEKLGIGSSHSATDYPTAVKDYNYNFSYKYSGKTVETAMAANRDLTYFFDIHRDSQRRNLTTAEIDGKKYAQVYFIVGHRNPNWRKNEEFATQIHEALEKKHPGLSRGIWGKGAQNGNGEYNQSASPNSILIEVGGPENTLEESYRTIDALAEVIADMYWQAERVNSGG